MSRSDELSLDYIHLVLREFEVPLKEKMFS